MTQQHLSDGGPLELLRQRAAAVFEQLPGALESREEAVHQIRVAGRRLRVTLPLVARKPRGRRVRRARRRLRELVRAAGRGRDLDVIVRLFDAEALDGGPERRLLRRHLHDARRRAHARLGPALLEVDVDGLRRHVTAILDRGTDGTGAALERVQRQSLKQAAAALAILDGLRGRYDAAALHDVRIRCRRLRYAAEVQDALTGDDSGAPGLLKTLQDRLGKLHDAHVLATWLEGQARGAARRGQAAVAGEARRQSAHVEALARARHGELLRADPAGTLHRAAAALGAAQRAA